MLGFQRLLVAAGKPCKAMYGTFYLRRYLDFLKDFSGAVVTDGYQVYHKLDKERPDLTIAGCWIHARRPFAEFTKSIGVEAAKGSVAQEAYDMITEIMHIDNGYDDLSPKDRKKQRQLHLTKKVDDYFAWVSQVRSSNP